MFARVLFMLLCLAHARLAAARVCPASCPLLVDPVSGADSKCCSIGDSAAGCGLCDTSSCPGNSLTKCGDSGASDCDAEGAGCSIVRAVNDCTSTGSSKCLGIVEGGTCGAAGIAVICQGNSGNCGTSSVAQVCG
ncbi:hypothetical protein B484DRAFT_394692 [Ochromonadaceae sp. CCMP2298]|nr:hypothetical protein B484DRAFT_394692 [Ochromonadaceae sp. CCMP2298]